MKRIGRKITIKIQKCERSELKSVNEESEEEGNISKDRKVKLKVETEKLESVKQKERNVAVEN